MEYLTIEKAIKYIFLIALAIIGIMLVIKSFMIDVNFAL